ncbi:MAG: NAD(+) diphosphatase [Synergistaceae bacterium]|nr:NAD(+) diphosphatase [Synergistaceae bacterium]
MYIFQDNKILVSGKTIYFDNFDAPDEFILFNSRDLPESWSHLPSFIAVNNNLKFDLKQFKFIDLRQVWHEFGEQEFFRAGGTRLFANWLINAKFCSHCGGLLEPNTNDTGRHCVNCKQNFYAPLSPAIIVAVTKQNKLLLAHNTAMIKDLYTVLAGFVEPGENLEQAVMRELNEEVGIKVKNIKYFGSQPWPFPQSLMIAFTAELDEASSALSPDGLEISDALWLTASEIKFKLNNNLIKIPDGASIARKLINNFLEHHAQ